MLAKIAAAACLVASATAFAPASVPALRSTGVTMAMERREAVTAGAAAAAVIPFLAANEADAAVGVNAPKAKVMMRANFYAPEVTVFDHRGCSRSPKEYQGGKTGTQDDEMLVKVSSKKVFCAEAVAAQVLAETLGSLTK
mmetsp:Transcript_16695/g.33346  ORF Transcript_16695/g.33346 Transcript_16695/m.33346 type:complete len:140 (-) Transcript_16695:100-519(-)|eukprot:CAMPEP_0181295624 /NCGR_PEP_ID=MMETSP1101-20121128/4250_1 /TAXON_ID=46948 /ORGANISM="Rhodomonas abbreviata, Strain Caron Lab Isolate" /LENGTH=139 /DNA_ID=CAMNT_0023400395 /DNA_START=19 /DNA_END=438 /DNA_ORIENTATION=+